MTTTQQIKDLITTNTELKGYYENHKTTIEGRVAAAEAKVDGFIAEAHPEQRYTQTVKIGGSTDYLYPVFWQFPDNSYGVSRLEISRQYWLNKPVLHATHTGSLLLQIEGNAYPWDGDANFLDVKRYSWRYNKMASHLQFGGWAKRRSKDSNPPSYGADGTNYLYSGIYLRGGGLEYHISSSWAFTPLRLPDEGDANSEVVLHEYLNTQFYVTRIPFSDLQEPVEG